MKLYDLTLDTLAHNLAFDEALLEEAEAGGEPVDALRLWEPVEFGVVIGRSSRIADEVDIAVCERRGIPVGRRCSGGASIVTGPGCLMYGVILSYQRHPECRMIEHAHQFVLGKVLAAIRQIVPAAQMDGTSDLTLADQKISGNSLRCKRSHLLYHGTILYGFPLSVVGKLLKIPPRQPEYRRGRMHGQFVTNLPANGESLRQSLIEQWCANEPSSVWPKEQTERLVTERYSQHDWNFRL